MPSGKEDGKAVSETCAERPSRFSWSDWKEIFLRVKDEISKDNIPIIAAGIAFYAMLALFPGIAALVGLYGLIAEPADVTRHINVMSGFLPADALEIIRSQTADLASTKGTNIGLASLMAIVLAIWGTRAGVNGLVTGLNIAYGEQ
ncbi:MAG: YhjD/YihY/BrkB family envelope integrity protein, partial [Haliea sp.]